MCEAYAIFEVQPDVKNFFQSRLNFFNPRQLKPEGIEWVCVWVGGGE